MREGRDAPEDVLRPPDEEVLTFPFHAVALVVALAMLSAGCASSELAGVTELAGTRASPARSGVHSPLPLLAPAPPVPSRNTAAVHDPAERARFACAVEVQRAQEFDPGRSLRDGSLLGAVLGGAAGAGLGALFGLIGDIPGHGASAGAIVGGGVGLMLGGLLRLDADGAAYERGLAACVAARTVSPPAPSPGLVEYRLRTLSMRHEAFASFLGSGELADGAAGPGLIRLAGAADAGSLERGIVLYDRHIAPVPASMLAAFGATAADARIKLGGAGRDYWDEARWYGSPGERTVWTITSRNRRPQEVRRVGLSDVAALAQFRPGRPPLFGATPQAAVAVPLSVVHQIEDRGARGPSVVKTLDPRRALGVVVARNDDAVFPDRVYLVVTHALTAATYEAVLAWGDRGQERGTIEPRGE